MNKKKRLPDDQRNRICLDCARMKHNQFDYERGVCAEDGHRIDQVNNHCWCRNFKFPDWRKARIENSEGYECTVDYSMSDDPAFSLPLDMVPSNRRPAED